MAIVGSVDQLTFRNNVYEIVPEIAPLFQETESYDVGDWVIYEANLYKFISSKPAGAWDVTKVDGPYTVMKEIDDVKNSVYTIVDNTSGSVAHFEDGADNIPLKSIKVNITPVQSGSDDPSPSNVRPISGYSNVKITRTGKNLAAPFSVNGSGVSKGVTYDYTDNVITFNGTSTGSNASTLNKYFGGNNPVPILFKAGVTYTVSLHGRVSFTNKLRIIFTDHGSTVSYYDSTDGGVWTFTPENDMLVTQAAIRLPISGSTVDIVAKLQIEVGDTATSFEEYSGNAYEVSFESAGTVYGGTLDVMSGVLILTHKGYAVTDVSELTADTGASSGFRAKIVGGHVKDDTASAQRSSQMCSHAPIVINAGSIGTSSGTSGAQVHPTSSNIYFYLFGYDTIEDTKTYCQSQITAGTPVTFVYPLAEPQTIQLTGTQIKSLLGINNMWSDVGDIDVEYRADTKLYINKKIQEALIL